MSDVKLGDQIMTYQEFEKRFVDHMVSRGASWVTIEPNNPEFPDAQCYGKQAAKAAWADIEQQKEPEQTERKNSPEDEADSDMSYWED